MKIKPMLGEFALDDIEYIESSESRALVEHAVPGLAGDYLQDTGTIPNAILIEGTKAGDEARDDFLTGIRKIFNEGKPTSFVADINTATEITDVLIEELEVMEIGGSESSFRYVLKLRQYVKPPEPPSNLDTGILSDALAAVEAFNLLDAFVSIPNLGDPSEPVSRMLDQVKAQQLDQVAGEQHGTIDREIINRSISPAPEGAPSVTEGEARRLAPGEPRVDETVGAAPQQMLATSETSPAAAPEGATMEGVPTEGIPTEGVPTESFTTEGATAAEPEVIDPTAPDLQIDPTDERIDVGAKFALQRMLKKPEMAADAARLIRGINNETLAGIFGDDLGVSAKIAQAHGTVRWELVPDGEDAALVLDAELPLTAPPTVIFRGDTPDIRNTPARIDPALQKASQTFALFQQGEIAACDSSASSTPVSNLVPPSFCHVQADLLVFVTEQSLHPHLPGAPLKDARVEVQGPAPSVEVATDFTGDAGEAVFPAFAHGSYRVTASKPGFDDASVEVLHPPAEQFETASFMPVSTGTPLIGTPGPILLQLQQSKLFTFKVKNRLFDENVPNVKIVVTPKGGADGLSAKTNSDGEVKIGLSDAEWELLIEPSNRFAGPVGPSVGEARGKGPDRLWREMEAEITVKNGKVTKVKGKNISTDGSTVNIKLQPVWMRSPNFSTRPTDEAATIDVIVLHGTGTKNIESAINTFMTNGEISAHYVIDLDGQIVKMVHEEDQAHHAGESHWSLDDSINKNSVGIEIVHDNADDKKLYTSDQYDTLLDKPPQLGLLNRIRDEHTNIDVEEIIGHSDIATVSPPKSSARRLGRKATDPGVNFDWSKLAIEGFGPNVKRIVNVSSMYGGLFDTAPNTRLQLGDNDAEHRYGNVVRASLSGIIAELQEDLGAIGYWIPVDGTYTEVTFWTVAMFQDHVFSVGSPHPDGDSGAPKFKRGEVDKITAIRIKEIRP